MIASKIAVPSLADEAGERAAAPRAGRLLLEVLMPGHLRLLGSGEFLPAMDAVDHALLGATSPCDGLVLSVASALALEPGMPEVWAARGRAHFGRLGVPVEAAPICDRADANDPRFVAAVAVVPHYDMADRWWPGAMANVRATRPEGVTVLCVDELTTASLDGSAAVVMGAGSVRIIGTMRSPQAPSGAVAAGERGWGSRRAGRAGAGDELRGDQVRVEAVERQ